MGFRSTWIAVPTDNADRALAATRLTAAGESDILETGWWLVELGDWSIVVGSGWDYMERITEEQARSLATPGEAYFWFADDSSMTAQMRLFRDGEEVWSLEHHEGAPTLRGDAPAAATEALAEQRAEAHAPDASANVDYLYEAAHIAGQRIVGFRHDEDPDGTLRELVPADVPKRIERCGPIDVEIIELPGMDTHVVLRARRKANITRIIERQFDRDGELRGVIEREGFQLARGAEERLYVHSPFAPIHFTIELSGLLGARTHDVQIR